MPISQNTLIASADSRHIPWEQLQERIALGVPFVHRVPAPLAGAPAVDILVSERGDELALRIPCITAGELAASPLAEMDMGYIDIPTGRAIEIKTRSRALFQDIYNFFVSVSDKIQLDGAEPQGALEETMDNWRELLRSRTILSEEIQLGLRGELWLLRRLTATLGDQVLAAWIGPQKQPHDFRLGNNEFEVKTTRGTAHIHIINGVAQLEPSLDHALYVLSFRMAPAGANAGTTLPDDIDATRALLGPAARVQFDGVLRTFKYKDEHRDFYRLQLQMADEPLLVPVDENCPRLTRELLAKVPHLERLSDIRYRANFDGLGVRAGTPEFEAILPR